MRVLLLAAGLGTRLRPITYTVPKCLVPIHGRPLLDYWLDLLFADDSVERVLINTHHLADAVRAFVRASRYRDRIDLFHEESLLGTGGTLAANHSYFGHRPSLIAHADNLTQFDLPGLRAAHADRPAGVVMTMLAFRADNPQACGILEIDELGRVQGFHEKVAMPPGNFANAAVYIVEPEIIHAAVAVGQPAFDLQTTLIPSFLGKILAVETHAYHRDIGTHESLRRAHEEFPPSKVEIA